MMAGSGCVAMFQSTRPRWARPLPYSAACPYGSVSIHAPARGATPNHPGQLVCQPDVSIHAPAMGATSTYTEINEAAPVSIHAPAMGATPNHPGQLVCQPDVSIHAPARGATSAIHNNEEIITCFNPRAREGRDVRAGLPNPSSKEFQSTRPRGARLTVNQYLTGFTLFQSTRPRGARPPTASTPITPWQFQSTRPRGARPKLTHDISDLVGRFNPRAREGRDACPRLIVVQDCVSIHAPARGATPLHALRTSAGCGFNPRAREGRDFRATCSAAAFLCFNPRAREGRDSTTTNTSACGCSFNPRAREGRDASCKHGHPGPRLVSIHAPARGATIRFCRIHCQLWRFNPRAREGRDSRYPSNQAGLESFNPRAREGRDRPGVHCSLGQDRFNPRAREGRDAFNSRTLASCGVSIHAPARGATIPCPCCHREVSSFNPRAREGRDVFWQRQKPGV